MSQHCHNFYFLEENNIQKLFNPKYKNILWDQTRGGNMKVLLTAVVALLIGGLAQAGDAAAGKAAALTCVACHGEKGISNNNLYPNLAGQKDAYTVKQLKAFKDGSRKDPTMNAMSKPLSDKQMEDIAAYFASLK